VSSTASPWLARYDAGVPATLGSYPAKTLVDFVAEHAAARPSATAIRFKGKSISFARLDHLSDVFAQSLRRLGVSRGDRVALVLPNCPQFLIAELAIWKLGAIIAPLNPLYTEREIEESLAITKPSVAIVLSSFDEQVKHVQPRTTLRRIISTNIKEYLPRPLRFLFTIAKEKVEGHRVTLRDGDVRFRDLMKEKPLADATRPLPGDPAILLMSGGTTGSAKAVLSSHEGMVMAGMQIHAWLRKAIAEPGA
jgi:long-chain acyl-CoA synthetase